jgi:hypothetical protein
MAAVPGDGGRRLRIRFDPLWTDERAEELDRGAASRAMSGCGS